MIRVLIVDDSAVLRQQLRFILQSDPELSVVGEARNGEEAITLAKQLHPDVVTMDIRMPRMDGFQAIRSIMADSPVPIVVVSANDPAQESEITSQAMKLGAVSVMRKPGSMADPGYKIVAARLIEQVKLMSEVRVVTRIRTRSVAIPEAKAESPSIKLSLKPTVHKPEIIAIGSSTGGPAALYRVLSALPANCPVPIAIVQHITYGFVEGLASWLSGDCRLKVTVATHGERLQAGCVYIAPDQCHMLVDSYGRVRLREGEPIGGHRPAVTALFQSVAESFGAAAVGVILTGMGADGAVGMKAMAAAGAITIAQDEKSCVVFGMPKEAIALGAVQYVVPLEKIPSAMMELCKVR